MFEQVPTAATPADVMAEKAVEVAKDVLARLDVYKVRPNQYMAGFYPRPKLEGGSDNDSVNLAMIEDGLEANCYVCALGACVLSALRKFGTDVPARKLLYLEDYETRPVGVAGYRVSAGRNILAKVLQDVFTRLQMSMIESAFELSPFGLCFSQPDNNLIYGAAAFGRRYGNDARKRLRAIMQNVVDNNGVFTVAPMTEKDHYAT